MNPPVEGRRGSLRALLGAVLLALALGVWTSTWPAAAGEPMLVRWLRACGEHPIRLAAALYLAWEALRPGGAALGSGSARAYDARPRWIGRTGVGANRSEGEREQPPDPI